MIVLPPSLPGALYETEAVVEPVAITETIVGVPGTEYGVMLLLAALAGPVPVAFVAVTVNV